MFGFSLKRMKFLKRIIILSVFTLFASFYIGEASVEQRDWLSQDSVVLICGAASYIGSEVALALHRTYSPKKLILVDELADIDGFNSLSGFEYQRQRLFRVLQELATAYSGEAVFYRVDLRPEVPGFVDSSVIPVLEYILKQHADITHIVYLPEEKNFQDKFQDNPRAIMMHALLDQLNQWENITGHSELPQFTYASSFEVYSGDAVASSSDVYVAQEDRPINEPPSSTKASAYLLDEILAQTFYKIYGIDSVGLRLFKVYGPFSTPRSLLSSICDYAVRDRPDSSNPFTLPDPTTHANYDFIYIDDAVDAVMTAMQLRPPPSYGPLVINVGSGRRTSVPNLVDIITSLVPEIKFKYSKSSSKRANKVDIVAHMARSKEILGWEPTVPLDKGVLKTLGWHFDRLFPQGRKWMGELAGQNKPWWRKIAMAGRLGCDLHDVECLRGEPIFPCVSECSHVQQCHPSFWDVAATASRMKSAECHDVLFTVALNRDLVALPSVEVHVSTKSRSHLPDCSFAFVSDESPLFQRMRSVKTQNADSRVHYEFWTLISVSVSLYSEEDLAQMLMVPKLTPKHFFSSMVKMAVYTDPYIILDDLPGLLVEAGLHPFNPDVPGATGLLVGKKKQRDGISSSPSNGNRLKQTAAYRMVHIKGMGYLNNDRDGFNYEIDSSFLVHRLDEESPSAFRCDVLSEIWSWKVSSDNDAISFVGGLHDMWSQIVVKEKGHSEPWWSGGNIRAAPGASQENRRRLEESDGVVGAPLQYHHLLQNQIISDKELEFEDVHRFDENGLVIEKEKRVLPIQSNPHSKPVPKTEETTPEEKSEQEKQKGDNNVANEAFQNNKTWLAMLSTGRQAFFVRLVYPEDVGVVDLHRLYDNVPPLLM